MMNWPQPHQLWREWHCQAVDPSCFPPSGPSRRWGCPANRSQAWAPCASPPGPPTSWSSQCWHYWLQWGNLFSILDCLVVFHQPKETSWCWFLWQKIFCITFGNDLLLGRLLQKFLVVVIMLVNKHPCNRPCIISFDLFWYNTCKIWDLRFWCQGCKKTLLHQNWHKIEWNYINVFQMLNRGEGHSKKAHFSSFCSRARISTSSLGDTATVFKCFHFAFWQNEIQNPGSARLISDMQVVYKKDQDIIWSVLPYCHPSLTSGAQMWLPNKPGSQISHQWCARGIKIPHGSYHSKIFRQNILFKNTIRDGDSTVL